MTALLVVWCMISVLAAYHLGLERGKHRELATVFYRSAWGGRDDSGGLFDAHTSRRPAPQLRGYIGRARDSVAERVAAE